jgi:hypothetical protein
MDDLVWRRAVAHQIPGVEYSIHGASIQFSQDGFQSRQVGVDVTYQAN